MNTEPATTDDFSSCLSHAKESLLHGAETDVPCGSCSACCTSSLFIHIEPEETKALGAIARELLFQAPGMPKGHVLMGYDKNGKCPMFTDSGCSIYNCRPRTCRSFDCRILAAAGLHESAEKEGINRQLDRWRFSSKDEQERAAADALKAAAAFILEHAALFPSGFVPGNPVQQAALALKVYDVFLDPERACGGAESSGLIGATVAAIIERYRAFHAGTAENAR